MEFTIQTRIDASPKEVYEAWLSTDGHTRMTGGVASISDRIGAKFTAWDGYIEGENIELMPYNRIYQSWRTADFKESEENSQIEILLKEVDGQTELKLIHTNLSESGEQYKLGWEEHYFQPMKKYFSHLKK